jgi:hypothetical protein
VIDLARNAGIAPERHGGLVLVPATEIGRLLQAFQSAGVRVLGAEGFEVTGSHVTPDMNAILDLSDVDDAAESIREARAFFERVDSCDLLFEFVIDEASGSSP